MSACRTLPPPSQTPLPRLQVGELGSRLHRACEAQYLAAMGLLRDISRHASTLARCYWQ